MWLYTFKIYPISRVVKLTCVSMIGFHRLAELSTNRWLSPTWCYKAIANDMLTCLNSQSHLDNCLILLQVFYEDSAIL